MGSAVIKRKIRSEGENTSKRIFCKNIFIHFRAEKRSSTAPFKGKDGAERGGVLFNSASQECTHFCFSLARKTYIICSEYIDVKNDGKKVKSIGGTRFLTFSRVYPRICCQCTRSVASIKPLSIRWSTHLWWWCFPNPLYFEMILGIWEWKQSRHSTPTHARASMSIRASVMLMNTSAREVSTLAILHSFTRFSQQLCVAALHGPEAL